MAKRLLPPAEELRQLLRYEPETGKLFWLRRGGKEAGSRCRNGYIEIGINCKNYLAHRIVWALYHGEPPAHQIDHIDGDRSNNRIANLRDVPASLNQRNRRRHGESVSGVTGVIWNKQRQKWQARVCGHTRAFWTKICESLPEAKAAVEAKRAEMGFTDRHGT